MVKKIKLCLISSSGGHYEQLKMLKKLENDYDVFWITEQTEFQSKANYYLYQTGLKDKKFPFKMFINFFKSLKIYLKEKPDFIITTGTMVALPISIIGKFFGKKVIYIETFARIHDGTKSGKLMYKIADLFVVQWETLLDIYPKAVFGGSIY